MVCLFGRVRMYVSHTSNSLPNRHQLPPACTPYQRDLRTANTPTSRTASILDYNHHTNTHPHPGSQGPW